MFFKKNKKINKQTKTKLSKMENQTHIFREILLNISINLPPFIFIETYKLISTFVELFKSLHLLQLQHP